MVCHMGVGRVAVVTILHVVTVVVCSSSEVLAGLSLLAGVF